jgi:hypothetical protein
MSRERQHQSRRSTKGQFAVIAILSMVSGQVWAADDHASAQSEGLFDSLMEKLDLRTKVGPMPDFVEKSRPDPSTLHFIPTGQPHPKRSVPVKSASEIEAAKSALDAARDAQLNPPPPVQLVKPKAGSTAVASPSSAKHPAKPKQAADQ